MGFSGHFQILCTVGHESGADCDHCENGRIDGHVSLEVDKPAVTQVCNLGHEHVIEEQTYKIPKGKGHLTKWGNNESLA